MKKSSQPKTDAESPNPLPKSRILTQLSIKRSRAGAEPPTGPKPVSPPRALSPAELLLKTITPPQEVKQVSVKDLASPPPCPGPAQVRQAISPIPPPGQQAPPEPPEEGNILEILFARAMRMRMDTKPADDPGVAMLQALSHQVQNSQPLKEIEDIIVPHLGEMSSKIHLWRNVNAYHNMFERAPLLNLFRWTMEKSLWEDLMSAKMSPVEKLALLNLAIKELDKIEDKLGDYQESLDKTGKGATGDIETAVEKPDRALSKVVDPAAKDLEGTSPVGRELARRIMFRAGSASEKIISDALEAKKPS